MPIGASTAPPAVTGFGTRPRLRSGYALKRLAAAEGPRRWVVKDLASGAFARLSDDDVRLLRLLDGRRSLAELVHESEAMLGAAGPVLLARLLADLQERRLLSGSGLPEPAALRGLARLPAARKISWTGRLTRSHACMRAAAGCSTPVPRSSCSPC